jgi:cytochrome c-type biogenesis protein
MMYNLIEAPLALLAGVLTVASPCVLPVLPIILGTSVGQTSRTRPLFIALGFVITFAAFGMLLSVVSSFAELAQDTLRNAGIALLAVAGLTRIWPAPYDWLMMRIGGPLHRVGEAGASARATNGGGFVLGMSLGAAWTPCAGPILASILALVARAQDLGWAATLLGLYAAGAGIPMLAIAYGGQFASTKVRAIARHTERLQQVFGALILLTAVAMFYQYDVVAYAWLADNFPPLKAIT